MGNFFQELRRRNVAKVVGAYLVVGWVLMQIATSLEESMNLPEWFDGVVVALLIVGLPVAIIVSWVFDLTAEGVVRTENSPGGNTNRKLNYLIGAALLVAGATFAWQSFDPDETEASIAATPTVVDEIDPATIAVLPFADLSPAGDQEYFSDGISEELLNLLASVDALNVTSRTSAFQFKGRGLGIPEIAERLNVRHVVEGSVRKSGETLRITAQLIDAADDRHLWSDTFDRPLTAENIFALQDEISKAIVNALGQELGFASSPDISVRQGTDNLTAYELYLQARPLYQTRTQLDVAAELLDSAIEQDPNFADAWALRAGTEFLLDGYGYLDRPQEEIVRATQYFADKALALDPDNSTAIASGSFVYFRNSLELSTSLDYAQLLADLSRAIEIDPRNASALNWRGLLYVILGKLESAIRDFELCIEISPLTTPCSENIIAVLAGEGRDQEAFDSFDRLLDKGIAKPKETDLAMLARVGEKTAFKMILNDDRLLFGWDEHEALYNALRNPNGDNSRMEHSLFQFLDANPDRNQYSVALVAAYFRPTVFEFYHLVMWNKAHAAHRKSSEFKDFVRQSGILSYWQEHGFPPQCRSIDQADFECD